MVRAALALCAVLAAACAPPRSAEGPPEPTPSPQRLHLGLGFAHWFGGTFGSPDGVTTPAFEIGARPGVAFVDVRTRYSFSVDRKTLPSGETSRVGFASLELALGRDFHAGTHTLHAFAGPLALVSHTGDGGGGPGYGVAFGAQYLIPTGLPHDHRLGPAVTARGVYYRLPGEDVNILDDPRRDSQVDIGLVTTLF